MRTFKTPSFEKDIADTELTNGDLKTAIGEIESGLVDARLGGELVKKRVARSGGGKSGGYRTVIAYRQAGKAFFLHLFAKNEKANISQKELAGLKALAKAYLGMTSEELDEAVKKQALWEVN